MTTTQDIELVTCWHVFTDNWDNWYSTIEQATEVYNDLCKDENANVRLYEEISEKDGDMIEENYISGQGGFPW